MPLHSRKNRMERTILRALNRLSNEMTFTCSNGQATIQAYKSRPTYLEDGEFGKRAVAGYELLITARTFKQLDTLAGDYGLFDSSCKLTDGEASYVFDRVVPYQALGMEAGYKLLVKKVMNDETV